jgi:asparagine synthase (glutamine-hydrolysing)
MCATFYGVIADNPSAELEALLGTATRTRDGADPLSCAFHRTPHLIVCCEHWSQFDGDSDVRCPDHVVGLSGYPLIRETSSTPQRARHLTGPQAVAAVIAGFSGPNEFVNIDGPFLAVRTNVVSGSTELVRDKFGLRNLYYYPAGDKVWFSDDLAPLLALAPELRLRLPSLLEWIHYGVPLGPDTFFSGLYVLNAGHLLSWSPKRGAAQVRYFEPSSAISAELASQFQRPRGSPSRELLRAALHSAIARATAGVKTASVLMSGGVDSSIVAALASRHTRVIGITVDLIGPHAQSEIQYASSAAQHIGVELRRCEFGLQDFRASLCDTIRAQCTPTIIENSVALHYAARTGAIQADQLILDGEGGDALFCGSTPLFKYSMLTLILSSFCSASPIRVRRVLESFRRSLAYIGLTTRTTIDSWGLDALLGARRMVMDSQLAELLAAYGHVRNLAAREIAALTLQEFYDYLVPLMLRIEAMGKAARSNVVLPFLFPEVFELSVNLPISLKVRWDWRRCRPLTKWILKEVAREYIPSRLVYRPKGGFGIPGGEWVGSFPSKWADESWLREQFGIPRNCFESWLAHSQNSRSRFFAASLEIWGRIFHWRQPFTQVRDEWLSER